MKKSKFKTLRRAVSFAVLIALVILLAAMPLIARQNTEGEEYPISVLSGQVQQLSLEEFIPGGGALTPGQAAEITIPEGVKIKGFLARNGDTVAAGDPIAQVDRVSLTAAIASTQEELEELRQQLETARQQTAASRLTGPKGVVKLLYAAAGDDVSEVMLEHGALAVLSLDGNMTLELETDARLQPGDRVDVVIDGKTHAGTVESCREGILKITVPDKKLPVGAQAEAYDREGSLLGTGTLAIHSPWNLVAYSGSVRSVSVKEGQTVWSGGTIMTLEEEGYSQQCQRLSARIRQQEDRMLSLFALYNDQTVRASAGGVVTGIDEVTAPMLAASRGWELQLLANAPNGRDDVDYINFVGQVTQAGSDGLILRLNPQMFAVSDYANPAEAPRDTAAMTETVRYTNTAPVYQRSEDSWVQTAAAPGDLLLFAGDSLGNIVWVVRLGSAPLPGEPEQPDQPTDPSDKPTDPTDPSNPDQGGETPPGEGEGEGGTPPGQGEATPGEGQGGTGGNPTIPGGAMPNIPAGSITIPSFGGAYSGQLPGAAGGQSQESAAPREITIASVSPREIMEIPITVDELDIHKIMLGMPVRVKVDALNLQGIPGTVTAIDRQGINQGASTKYTVTVTLAWQQDMLPGMNASVTIPLAEHAGTAVPTAALESRMGKTYVYTSLDPKTGEPTGPVEVLTGFSNGEYTLVEGLSPNATVYYFYYEALNS